MLTGIDENRKYSHCVKAKYRKEQTGVGSRPGIIKYRYNIRWWSILLAKYIGQGDCWKERRRIALVLNEGMMREAGVSERAQGSSNT